MGSFFQSTEEVVGEIMRAHKSLPMRPGVDEVGAAKCLILNVEKEEQFRIDVISKKRKGPNIPDELFSIMQEMQRNLVLFQGKEQKREAVQLLELENIHALFDELIQRALNCISSSSNSYPPDCSNGSTSSSYSASNASVSVAGPESSVASSVFCTGKDSLRGSEMFLRDDSYLKKSKASYCSEGVQIVPSGPHVLDSSLKYVSTSAQDGEKLSLIKLASLIEVTSKKGTKELNLQHKLMDQIQWLPDSIGKLSGLVTLDLSENRIAALPATIGNLYLLTKLDLRSNKIAELPECIGDLFSLVYLNLGGNGFTSLPAAIGRLCCLEELDVSSNKLSMLPESIGNLIHLKKLKIETNNIEEIPYAIGKCASLVELRADYNRLKAIPEAVGRIASLELLSVRYNNIRQLPTTMASLTNLKELDVSFNELEVVPESLCLVTTLVKMNVGSNFANLQWLPRSIGKLEKLEELDISNNQIRVLPESLVMLSGLRVLRAEENPLEVPPRHVAEKGVRAVIEYMTELIMRRDNKVQPIKRKKNCTQFCLFSRPNKKKHDGGLHYVKA